MHYGLTRRDLQVLAYEFAKANNKTIPASWENKQRAGKQWHLDFVKRRNTISLRKPQPTSLARSTSFNKHNVSTFFEKLKGVIEKHQFTADKIFNLDESGNTNVHVPGDSYSPALILSAVGCAEANSQHPTAAAILKYVREVLGCEIHGTSNNFQAVPGCGLKCVVSDLSSSIKNAKNSAELSSFSTLVSAGSSGSFKVKGVEVLFGLLAVSQARPEAGYNYPQQQIQLQLSHSQTSSAQQVLPQISQIPQGPQQLVLGQNQQISSYQPSPPPLSSQPSSQYNLPIITVPQAPLPQANSVSYTPSFQQNLPQGLPILSQFSSSQSQQEPSYQNLEAPSQIGLSQSQQNLAYQQSLPQFVEPSRLPSISAGPVAPQTHQLINILPQGPQLSSNIDIPQNIPQLPLQPQNQILIPNLQVSQIQQIPLPSQGLPNSANQLTFNQISENQPQQQILTPNVPQPQLSVQDISLPTQGPVVTKHVYIHVAPEEPALPPQVIPPSPPPRKHYKIIFIKAPSQSASQSRVIHVPAAQPIVEEKTLVYVLVNKPHQPEIVIPTPAPTQPSKPEVYFVKYKANAAVSAPGADLGLAPGGSQPIVEDLKRGQNQEQPINSGESTSSLFSGGLPGPSTKYGPPGYQ